MADHIQGPLYYERMGRIGPVMAFVHPNPLDQSCWLFQMAHFSTWFRCIAMDIPGYGRSPKAEPGLTLRDIAVACWEAIDDAWPGEHAILVGCSVGSQIIPYMYHHHPARTAALIMSGVGYDPTKAFAGRLIEAYSKRGNRLSRVAHRAGDESRLSFQCNGAIPRRAVPGPQWPHRRAVAHPSVPRPPDARSRRSSFGDFLPCPDHHRDRGWRTSDLIQAARPHSRLRAQGHTRRRPHVPSRAAVAVQSDHDRVPGKARSVSRIESAKASMARTSVWQR